MARSQDTITTQKRAAKRPKLRSSNSSPLPTERPIATNSRIKQDEKYRRDMYLVFVNDALQKKSMGITEPFDELVSQFNVKRTSVDQSTPPYQPAQLRLWFSSLSHVVSRLERTHAGLVQAIINMPWTTLDAVTVKSYTVFLGNLLSARPEYLSLVLGKIAQGFTYQSGLQALHDVGAEASSSPLTHRVIYDRLHDLLQHLLSLIPTLPTTLQPLLVRNFPHKRQTHTAQATYIRNLLRVSSYCPEAADKIVSTIIDRAIQIDVEIQVEVEELEEEEEIGQQEELFEMDPFDIVVGQGDESSSDSESEVGEGELDLSDISSEADDNDEITSELPPNLKHIQDMVRKLDTILSLIFEHFERTHASTTNTSFSQPSSPSYQPSSPKVPDLPPLPSPTVTATPTSIIPPLLTDVLSKRAVNLAPSEQLRAQFNTLLSIFDRTILRTFKSRYTQFLVFWFTSLDPEFADVFQGMLIDRALFALDSNLLHPSVNNGANTDNLPLAHTPTVTRAAAASYIGSFVSRATFVDGPTTRQVVGVLCDFLCAHLDAVDEVIRACGASSVMGINEGRSGAIGRAQNTVFYAVTQAVLLIFCFRWRDLLEDAEGQGEDNVGALKGAAEVEKSPEKSPSVAAAMAGKKWVPELGVLQRVVTSVLNPLKICSPNVVMQFARVAHATDFLYCFSILESNKRSEYALKSPNNTSRSISTTASSLIHSALLFGDGIATELNTFFPFDPCRLHRSSSYIQDIYREWSSVAVGDDEEEDDEEDDDMNQDAYSSAKGMWSPESDESDDSHAIGNSDPEIDPIRFSGTSITLGIPISRKANSTELGMDHAANGLGASLDAMSISPGHPVIK